MNLTRKTFFATVLGCFLLTAMLSGCGKTSGTEAGNKVSNTEVSNETTAVTSDGGNATEQASENQMPEDDDSFWGYQIKELDVTPYVSSWHDHYFLYTSGDGLYGVVSHDGEIVTEPKYTKVFGTGFKKYDTGIYYGVVKGERVEKIDPADKSVTVLDYDDVRGVTGSAFGNSGYLFVNEKLGRWDMFKAEDHLFFTDNNGIEYGGLKLVASSEQVHDDLIAAGYSEEMASRYPERYEEELNTLCFKGATETNSDGVEVTYWTYCSYYRDPVDISEKAFPSELLRSAFCPENRLFAPSEVFIRTRVLNARGVKDNAWRYVGSKAFEDLRGKEGETYDATFLRYNSYPDRWGGHILIGKVLGREQDTYFRPLAYLDDDKYLGAEVIVQDGAAQKGRQDWVVASLNEGGYSSDDIYTKLEGTADLSFPYLQKSTDKRGNLSWTWNGYFALANDAGDRFTLYKLPEYGETEVKKVNETPYTSLDIGYCCIRVGYEDGTYGYVYMFSNAENAEISGPYKYASIPGDSNLVLVSEDGESFYFLWVHDGSRGSEDTIDAVEAYQLAKDTYCIKKADGSYWILYK